ncbi:hypothetical protein CCP3SC15_360015 [Gammaproteobacteria bacterium]
MGEQIAGGRTAAMLMIAGDMEEIRSLSGLVEELKRHLEGEKTARFNILAKLDADVADLEEQIANAQDALIDTTERLDRTMKEMFFTIPTAPEKSTKTKKSAVAAATEAVKEFGEAMKNLAAPDEKAEPVEVAIVAELPAEVIDPEEKGELDELLKTPARVNFEPLDAPLGDCELCQGWGVIDGELYGEFALVPCTCQAGNAVRDLEAAGDPRESNREEVQVEECPGARACEDYVKFTENPGSQYNAPGAALVGIPCYLCGKARPANCTGCPYRFDCTLDPTALDCRDVFREGLATPEGIEIENHNAADFDQHLTKIEEDDEKGWADPPGVEKAAEVIKVEPSALQLKCPHPKPFRKMIEGQGVTCEVCKLLLEPIEAATEKAPGCCTPQRRRSDVDETTGNRILSCMDCGRIHRIQDPEGKDLPLPTDDSPPWEEDGPDMAPESRTVKGKKKTTPQG